MVLCNMTCLFVCLSVVEDVKCKFKNLRTVFNREYKAVQACRASDKLYVSKWKHYQQLLFLCESCDEDDNTDDLQVLMPQEDREHGEQTPSSTLSSFTSSSTQANGIKFSNTSARSRSSQTNVKTNAAYQIFSVSPDDVKPAVHTAPFTFPASPSPSPPDIKTRANPSSLKLPVCGPVQADGRPSTDSRCHWSDAKVQQLIAYYSGRWPSCSAVDFIELWDCVDGYETGFFLGVSPKLAFKELLSEYFMNMA